MQPKTFARSLYGAWLFIYSWSIVSLFVATPTGDGFTRGLNRIAAFVGWQALAAVVAIGIWMMGRHFPPGSAGRWLCRLPVTLAALLFLLIAGLLGYAWFGHPPPQPANAGVLAPPAMIARVDVTAGRLS